MHLFICVYVTFILSFLVKQFVKAVSLSDKWWINDTGSIKSTAAHKGPSLGVFTLQEKTRVLHYVLIGTVFTTLRTPCGSYSSNVAVDCYVSETQTEFLVAASTCWHFTKQISFLSGFDMRPICYCTVLEIHRLFTELLVFSPYFNQAVVNSVGLRPHTVKV